MAGTIHQAMAYLGLTAEQNEDAEYKERSTRHSRDNFSDYDEDLYDYEDEQLDTHELGSLQEPAVSSVRVNETVEEEPVRQDPASSSRSFARVERKLAESEVAPKPAEPELTIPTISSSKNIENPAPAAFEQSSNHESDDQLRQITTIHPRSYNDAKIIGESFRENIPVIMNVTDMGEAEAKRLVDFSAGLAFALHGSIERVTDKVFLLTPTNLEVLAPEGAEVPVALDADSANLFNQG